MSDQPPKEAAPDPEIPDELKSKLSRPKRPANYRPISGDEGDNPPEEKLENKLRDVRPFFKKLKLVLKAPQYRTVIEEREVKKRVAGGYEITKVKTPVRTQIELGVGEDGLPFTTTPVSGDETRSLRSRHYPEAPKLSATHGDLTPEFVEWLYLTHPYDAAVRYFGRSTHVQINPH